MNNIEKGIEKGQTEKNLYEARKHSAVNRESSMFACQQEEATTMLPQNNYSAESNRILSSPTSGISFQDSPIHKGMKANINLRTKLDQERSADMTRSTIDTFTPNSWKTGQSSLDAQKKNVTA